MFFWVVSRHLRKSGKFVAVTTGLSVLCMSVGVASLLLAMAVVSGFEKTIKDSVIDLTGHVLLFKNNAKLSNAKKIEEKILKKFPSIQAVTPFLHKEAVLAAKGKVQGVVVQAFPPNKVDSVLNLRQRVSKGLYSWAGGAELPACMLGKELALKLNLSVGDTINIVLPKPNKTQSHSFVPKLKKFKINAILDLGKFEYNERFVMLAAKDLQDLMGVKNNIYTAFRIRLDDRNKAAKMSFDLVEFLGDSYWTKDWFQVNRIFFSAVEIEKRLLFFILLIMLIAACFNFSASLFVNVYRRYSDISIFKTMGANGFFFMKLFGVHGILVGLMGCVVGSILAVAIAALIPHLSIFSIPAKVYQISHLPIDFRVSDILTIYSSTMFLSLVSTIVPSWIGSKLSAVEGLRYE